MPGCLDIRNGLVYNIVERSFSDWTIQCPSLTESATSSAAAHNLETDSVKRYFCQRKQWFIGIEIGVQ
ncbi:hypothetical protein BMS3Bbin04_00704 [bacterium BMS3Bbin04]|nr:hypothetical protein BMS3Bbin04_00704 [bacterium BMS3Bbin04]